MSFGGGYPTFDATAPDSDVEIICPDCTRLLLQIANQRVVLTFGVGPRGRVMYGQAEMYQPLTGQIARRFDALKVRAGIPAAELPPGVLQAHLTLTPLVT